MSWAEVQNLKDKMSALADATLYINVGKDYAGKTLMLKRYDSDYMSVTVGSQGTAEVSVQPKSRYELVTSDAADGRTSDVFYVEAGDYKEVNWDMSNIDGSTAMPLNDVVLLQKCAGVYDAYKYTTVDAIIADSAALTKILASDNAVDYLVRSTGFATKFLNSAAFATAITTRKDVLFRLACTLGWTEELLSTQYTAKYVPDEPQIPTTQASSVTFSNGEVISSTTPYENAAIYAGSNAFFRNTQIAVLGNYTDKWIYYKFNKRIVLKTCSYAKQDSPYNIVGAKMHLEGSNDGITWTNIATISQTSSTRDRETFDLTKNTAAYQYIRLHTTDACYNDGKLCTNGLVASWLLMTGVKEA